MAKPSLQDSDDKLFSLVEAAGEFLEGDGQVMLIMGDSGAGKSTFNQYLENVLWQDYKTGGRIPLFINLPAIKEPEENLVEGQLKKFDFSKSQIKELE